MSISYNGCTQLCASCFSTGPKDLDVSQQQTLLVLEAQMPRLVKELETLAEDRDDPTSQEILEKLDGLKMSPKEMVFERASGLASNSRPAAHTRPIDPRGKERRTIVRPGASSLLCYLAGYTSPLTSRFNSKTCLFSMTYSHDQHLGPQFNDWHAQPTFPLQILRIWARE